MRSRRGLTHKEGVRRIEPIQGSVASRGLPTFSQDELARSLIRRKSYFRLFHSRLKEKKACPGAPPEPSGEERSLAEAIHGLHVSPKRAVPVKRTQVIIDGR